MVRRAHLVQIFALFAIVFIAYCNVYQNSFLYDDEFLIQTNSFLRSWDSIFKIFQTSSTAGAGGVDAFYRPLQGLSYLTIFQLFGQSTEAFHFLNVALHALNAMLMYLLGQRLGFRRLACFAATLIWAAHPVHTEAVTYMSATADPMSTFFILLGLWVLVPAFKGKQILWASGFYILAILSKEPAVVFLPLSLICLAVVSEKRWKIQTYIKTWPFFLITAIYLGLRQTVLHFDGTFNFYKQSNVYTESILIRVYTFLSTIPAYIKVFVWPDLLTMDREFAISTSFWLAPVLIGAVILILLFGKSVWDLKRGRVAFAFGIFWFFASFFPETGILIPVNSVFLEHWLYLPLIGLLLGLSETFARFIDCWPAKTKQKLTILMGVIVVATVGLETARTLKQNEVWEGPIVFYSHILENSKTGSARVHNNLAMALSDAGRNAEASTQYLEAIKISDVYPQTRYNLSRIYVAQNNIEEAIVQLKRSIELDPDFFQAYGLLAQIYKAQGNLEQAEKYTEGFEKAKSHRFR